jgi:Domain of unknown function (DUF4263)
LFRTIGSIDCLRDGADMKRLINHALNAAVARSQWQEYVALLKAKPVLSEARDVLPFFNSRNDLSLLIGNYFPDIRKVDVLAHEFQINGDFRADLVVGDSQSGHFLLVEFENGSPDSIFQKVGAKANPDWARRFEAAFSQLVDWLWKLEDTRTSTAFEHTFSRRDAKFQGLIVAGKDMKLAPQEKARLRWRVDKVMVDSKAVSCVSFDELATDLDFYLSKYHGV